MWPFRRRRDEKVETSHLARKVIVGLVIGGAISSIIGKKLLDRKQQEHDEDDEKKGESEDR
ncbi:MAG: hypothetical protein WCS85_04275 [Candidatus Peribacteraceae bacterium]|jgi:hypothetical protein